VRDVEAAKRFFAFLGSKEVKSVVISGKVMEDYMGVKGIEAEHVTLAIENLPYRNPEMIVDADVLKPNKLGFNHICFAVDDLEAEIAKLTAAGVRLRNEMMGFSQPQARLRVRPGKYHSRTCRVALIFTGKRHTHAVQMRRSDTRD
jgi:catechol 2,3-dioxygenase-like lactoylglutathione lyase family enzyme